MHEPKIRHLGIALAMGLTLTACAPTATSNPTIPPPSSTSSAPVQALPVVTAVFGPADWSAQARSGSDPLVLGEYVVITTDDGVSAVNGDGKEEWQNAIDILPNTSRPDGVRDLIAVTQDVVAVIDVGTLPKGSDPLASEVSGTRITLLRVKDGSEIAQQTLPGDQVTHTTGLAFKITGNGVEYVAFSPTGERIIAQDGQLPVATVGEHVVWGELDIANMGAQTTHVTGLPLENANFGASDDRGIVTLNSYNGNATTTMWVNLATSEPLTPDASCPQTLMPKALTSSPDGAFVVGDNAIADVSAGTITCTGGGGQKPVLWRAVTNEGVAYGQTADANDTFVIERDGEVETYPIPADAARTVLIGFTGDNTAILFNRDAGIINANPIL